MATNKKTAEIAIGEGRRGPGRPKGSPNKVNRDVKDMVLAALSAEGGERYLRRQARENPGAFMVLVGKLVPKQAAVEITQRTPSARDMTDAELLAIAAGGSLGQREGVQ